MTAGLTGKVWFADPGWYGEVPRARGDRARVRRSFQTQADAQVWLEIANAALDARQPIPEPETVGLAVRSPGAPSGPRTPIPTPSCTKAGGLTRPGPVIVSPVATTFLADAESGVLGLHSSIDEVAWAWYDEEYEELAHTDPRRAEAVKADLANHVLPVFHAAGLVDATMAKRGRVKVMWKHWAGTAPLPVPRPKRGRRRIAGPAPAPDPSAPSLRHPDDMWMTEVIAAGGVRSTVARAQRDGKLVITRLEDGKRIYSRAELLAGGYIKDPTAAAAPAQPAFVYASGVTKQFRWLTRKVLAYARDEAGWPITFDLSEKGIRTPRSRRGKAPKRAQFTFTHMMRCLPYLSPIDQITLLLIRVMGLRIGEAFGIRIEHIIDLADVPGGKGRGLLKVCAQGGTRMLVFDPETNTVITVDAKDELKTDQSYRTLVIPAMLMAVIREIIAVFHTVDGVVRTDARLIPGRVRADAAGQSTFRLHLRNAAAQAGINLSVAATNAVLLPTPHDGRRGVITDLAWTPGFDEWARNRWAGHGAGTDVESLSYILDHPENKPMRRAAKKLEKLLAPVAPNGLMVPTTTSGITGSGTALRARAPQIEGALVDRGWLVNTTDIAGADLLDTNDIASMTGVDRATAARWLREKHIPSQPLDRDKPHGRRGATAADVTAYAETLDLPGTPAALAKQVGVSRHRVYAKIASLGLSTDRVDGWLVLDPADAETVRAALRADLDRDARAMPVSAAAEYLGYTTSAVIALANAGDLVTDPATGVNNARYLTRASVHAYADAHPANPRRSTARAK